MVKLYCGTDEGRVYIILVREDIDSTDGSYYIKILCKKLFSVEKHFGEYLPIFGKVRYRICYYIYEIYIYMIHIYNTYIIIHI